MYVSIDTSGTVNSGNYVRVDDRIFYEDDVIEEHAVTWADIKAGMIYNDMDLGLEEYID